MQLELVEKTIATIYDTVSKLGLKIIAVILIGFFGVKIARYISEKFGNIKFFDRLDPNIRGFVKPSMNFFLYVVIILTCSSILGIDMTGFITVLASCAVAVGMAMQGSLSNIAGGVMLLINHPFHVGDYVECGGQEGTVQSISLFYTILYTVDNKQVTIPNSNVTSTTIVNYTINGKRRLDMQFTVSYDSDIDKVKEVLLNTVKDDKRVFKNPKPFARLKNHLDSSLEFTLRVWVKNDDYWDLYFDLMERVKKDFDANGIEIPYPQLDIHTKN